MSFGSLTNDLILSSSFKTVSKINGVEICSVSGIFGQKLEETVRYERRFGNKLAPMLVEQCVDFIRQWGLQEEGLFRLPGQANLVKELQDAFDCGEKPSFDWYGWYR